MNITVIGLISTIKIGQVQETINAASDIALDLLKDTFNLQGAFVSALKKIDFGLKESRDSFLEIF